MTLTLNLEELAAKGLIDSSWVAVLSPVQADLDKISARLNSELEKGHQFLPVAENIMRVFQLPFDSVRVVIVGQDPYPTPGDAVGLSFSVSPDRTALPRSLKNIFAELQADLETNQPANGDLTPWVEQGVLLLNRVLSVRPGQAGSHRSFGWELVTQQALKALNARTELPLVAVLWGNDAIAAEEFLSNAVIIKSVHPSPLSASRGFIGSKPFSKVNNALIDLGQAPINWALPSQSALF
jgi:uracil-DNA glycosylase